MVWGCVQDRYTAMASWLPWKFVGTVTDPSSETSRLPLNWTWREYSAPPSGIR